MKLPILAIVFVLTSAILSPAFQCGDDIDQCGTYTRDTALFNFAASNNTTAIHVGDVLNFQSIINDTLKRKDSSSFVNQSTGTFYTSLNVYKVNGTTGNYSLAYSNIDFDPAVTTGQFAQFYGSGISILYNRNAPYNMLAFTERAGRPGLYVIQFNASGSYGNNPVNESRESCKIYTGQLNIPPAQRRLDIWDSLSTTSLRLSPSNFPTVNKTDANYIFVRVLP